MKKIHFVLMVFAFNFLPFFSLQAQVPSQVRVGLERRFKNVSSISIANTHIQTGGQNYQSADGFTVRLEGDGRVALSGGGTILAASSENMLIKDANGGAVSMGGAKYRGAVEFVGGQGVTAVNILTVDEYLYGVVASEMPANFHLEALKAQSVAARSYMLTRMGIHKPQGYDLCDLEHCQAYRGMGQEHEGAVQAVNETKGLIMYYESQPINAVYFSSSGGMTDDSENVWTETVPYLRATVELVPESEPRVWSRFFSWNEINALLSASQASIGTANGMSITRTSPTGRVQELMIQGTNGQKVLSKEEIRTFFSGSADGMLESRNFNIGEGLLLAYSVTVTDGHDTINGTINNFYGITEGNGIFNIPSAIASDGTNTFTYDTAKPAEASGENGVTLSGSGWGHGVGMSQRGAEGMALSGYGFLEILMHYYTGVTIY